jgi:hypothetical protein
LPTERVEPNVEATDHIRVCATVREQDFDVIVLSWCTDMGRQLDRVPAVDFDSVGLRRLTKVDHLRRGPSAADQVAMHLAPCGLTSFGTLQRPDGVDQVVFVGPHGGTLR